MKQISYGCKHVAEGMEAVHGVNGSFGKGRCDDVRDDHGEAQQQAVISITVAHVQLLHLRAVQVGQLSLSVVCKWHHVSIAPREVERHDDMRDHHGEAQQQASPTQ